MNVPEALRVLGAEPQSTAEQARRAYLRKLKQHKPEVDPEGFRKLREAYECVCKALAAADSDASQASQAPNGGAHQTAGSPDESALKEPVQSAARQDERPDSSVEPAGHLAGLSPMTAIELAAAAGDLARATELALSLLEESSLARLKEIPLEGLIQLKLRLHAEGQREAAAQLGERLVHAQGILGTGPLPKQALIRFQLARELDLLGTKIPLPIHQGMATALAIKDIEWGCGELILQTRADPASSRLASTIIPTQAPGLWSFFGPSLALPRKTPIKWWHVLLNVVVIGLFAYYKWPTNAAESSASHPIEHKARPAKICPERATDNGGASAPSDTSLPDASCDEHPESKK